MAITLQGHVVRDHWEGWDQRALSGDDASRRGSRSAQRSELPGAFWWLFCDPIRHLCLNKTYYFTCNPRNDQVGLMWWFGLVVWGAWEMMIFDIFLDIFSLKLMMFLSCLLGHWISFVWFTHVWPIQNHGDVTYSSEFITDNLQEEGLFE